jgi:hypothetical protein
MKTQLLPDAADLPEVDEEICRIVKSGTGIDHRHADHQPSRVGICNDSGQVYRRVDVPSVDQLTYLLQRLTVLGFRVVKPVKTSMFEWGYDAIVVR